jgi:hypothetical protein
MAGRCYERMVDNGSLSEAEGNPLIYQAYSSVLENYPFCKASPIAKDWIEDNN